MGIIEYSVSDYYYKSWLLNRILDYGCEYCSGVG